MGTYHGFGLELPIATATESNVLMSLVFEHTIYNFSYDESDYRMTGNSLGISLHLDNLYFSTTP